MSFSLQRNVIFSHVDVKNRVLKISKTTSFFDISSCFFWDAALFSFFSEALHCFDGLAKFFEKPVRCQWSQRFSPTVTQDKLFQFRVFFCVDSIIQPSWKGLSTICQRFASLPQWTGKKRRFFAFVWSILCFDETLWHVWFSNFWHVTPKHGFHLQKQWCAWRVCASAREDHHSVAWRVWASAREDHHNVAWRVWASAREDHHNVAWRVCTSAREHNNNVAWRVCVCKLTWTLLPHPTPPNPTPRQP